MPNALTRRFEEYVVLGDRDRAELARISSLPARTISARRNLIREGDCPQAVYLIMEGWACQYRELDDGRRQIVDFAIPGDLCDLNLFILDRMDHSIGGITRLKVVEIGRETFHKIVASSPAITSALWWQELVSKSIHREWILNVGQRRALERIAHLFCEMFLRLESVGLTEGFCCEWPLTQNDIADATGLTAVHVNRTLQQLRQMELIDLTNRRLKIPDMAGLQIVGRFNADYLHHHRNARHTDRTRAGSDFMPVPMVATGEA
jgi:CRP-like cAMP-binding protein